MKPSSASHASEADPSLTTLRTDQASVIAQMNAPIYDGGLAASQTRQAKEVATQSRLVQKPLLLNVLHGGGQILSGLSDPNSKLMQYWITHPAPQGQDEFSPATYALFTPADPNAGTCNTQ